MKPVDDLPSNSRLSNRREVKKVVQGNVTTLRRPFLMRLFSEMLPSVGQYVVEEILIPAAKATLNDVVANALEMMLYGEPQRYSHRRDRSETYVSYNHRNTGPVRNRFDKPGIDEKPVGRSRSSVNDVVIADRTDAQEVLNQLAEIIDQYEFATVSDFYEMLGLEANWTDNNIGWDDLGSARVLRVRGGYTIDFPRPIKLD
jgi:hypothetical protein